MSNYLLIYTGGNPPASEAEGAAVMQAWIGWFTRLGPAVVDGGNPTAPMAKHIGSDGKVSDGPIGAMCTGYSVLKADSYAKALEMAGECPHLGAGGQVTVYETVNVM
ncbi:MAG: hypothetical protein KA750_05720 [Thermoflexales bacterium]|jgi:hypothetical protein|nr:hypothetical protein [Thermoflexales bacterium]MBP8241310.1 hypothetical protein [Thermoflexales bacterium]